MKEQLPYLDFNSPMTLREGIKSLRSAEGEEGDASAQVSPELVRDLEIHDAVHVLFGCTTTLRDEVVAHVWTAIGTTAPIGEMHRTANHQDHRAILSGIGHLKLVKMWLRSLPRIVSTLFKARRMKRRWPVEQLSSFLDRPLKDIRQEFGISF